VAARIARALAFAALLLAGPLVPAAAFGASTFQATIDGRALSYTLPGSSVVTLKWAPGAATADAWLTSASASALTRKLEASTVVFGLPASGQPTIALDPGTRFQTMDGFGGAMTDSSAWLIAASPQRGQIMSDLFAASGARFTYTRLPVGASDFAATPQFRSYDDMPAGQADPTLARFSIAHDEAYIIPLLKQARQLSPAMKIVAAPWSAPGWMKNGGTFFGDDCSGNANYLKTALYPTYAQYLTKFVTAYGLLGVPIQMLSLQNEPRSCGAGAPTMSMEPADQANLAAQLRPALDAAGHAAVKLMAWDHNWVEPNGAPTTYPQQALNCSGGTSNSPIDAVGYHDYGGEAQLAAVQAKFHADCAGKDIYFTEASGFASATNTAANLAFVFRNVLIGPIRNWTRASLYWNLALDENHGPHQGGCAICTGMVTVKADGSYVLNETYYYWKHFSKFVDPGAVRIDSTDPADGSLLTAAFRNPDGTTVLVAANPASPDPPPPPPPVCADNPFAWLFGGCGSNPPPAPPPPPPPPSCTGNPFAWLWGGC
jgi:glucosylceramidase